MSFSALPHTVYNTALEQHLRDNLGVRFAERPGTDPSKRPIREIVGVDPRLNRRWSTRRAHINVRRGELAIQFQHDHGRPPTPVEALHLAQQATLETRDANTNPDHWPSNAHLAERSRSGVRRPQRRRVDGATALTPRRKPPIADAHWVAQTADRVLAAMEETRSTWQMWHVRAEAQRHLRTVDMPVEQASALVDLLVDEVLELALVALAAPDGIDEPECCGGSTGGRSTPWPAPTSTPRSASSMPTTPGHRRRPPRRNGPRPQRRRSCPAGNGRNGTSLDTGQASLVRQMCTSGSRLQLAIAPAGAGKTTAMRALTLAWTQDGGQVIGLAPSAAAAAVLGEQTGIRTDTLAKLTWSLRNGGLPDWATEVGPATLIIIDEAGMADTLSLDTAVRFAIDRGASVRLIGDDQQLAAIGAGGVLRDIKHTHGALHLTELHRFTDPAEAQASLRSGRRSSALGFYLDHGRVMSVISPRPPRMPSLLGSDRAPDLTRSCSPPPASLSPTQPPSPRSSSRRCPGRTRGASGGREPGQCRRRDHHPRERSTPSTLGHRLGQERRPLDHHHVDRSGGLTVRHSRSQLNAGCPRITSRPRPDSVTPPPSTRAQGVSADTMHAC